MTASSVVAEGFVGVRAPEVRVSRGDRVAVTDVLATPDGIMPCTM